MTWLDQLSGIVKSVDATEAARQREIYRAANGWDIDHKAQIEAAICEDTKERHAKILKYITSDPGCISTAILPLSGFRSLSHLNKHLRMLCNLGKVKATQTADGRRYHALA